MQSRVQQLIVALLSLAAVACASAPEHLYTLETAYPHPAARGVDAAVVVVGPISVPELIDRPQLVVHEGDYTIVISEQERWAAPLKESLPRVLAAELDRQSQHTRFLAASSVPVATPSAHLVIDITSLDINRDRGVTVVAQWAYRPVTNSAKPIERVSEVHADVTAPGYAGFADGVRRATVALADGIAAELPESISTDRL